MAAKTDFNQSPYFDDYTPANKYYRILYRPGYAVQARELTQSQSILQNQIEKVSDFLFEKGAMVIPGDISFDLNFYAVKLASKTYTDIQSYVGLQLIGVTSGIVATCVYAVAGTGNDPDTLYVKYNSTGNNNSTFTFTTGETINARTISTTTTLASAVVYDATLIGSSASINAGVYYINGFQVSVDEQTIILDKYTNTPSYRVGLYVTEQEVSSNDDSSLLDNAQGSTNYSAPGADRFKITLTLTALPLTSTNDQNFVELLRLSNGIRQNRITSTTTSILEDTLARRTFDESGDYSIKDFDIDLREQYNDGTNRGVYTSANGGLTDYSQLTAILSQGKAYVKGYEIQTVGPSYLNIPKARSTDYAKNTNVNFTVGNYVNVSNVYGTPDIGYVSGNTTAYKKVDLFSSATVVRGSELTTSGVNVPQIGIAKSKGFELNSGTSSAGAYVTSSLTSAVYKHYLFDIEFYTHLNVTTAPSFTNGEKVTGGTSGATGYVQTLTSTKSATIGGITQATTAVVTATGHTFREGQQITISSVGGMTQVNGNVYTVRSPSTNTFSLYATDGITPVNSSAYTAYTSGGTATHGVIVLNNVTGTFVQNEVITGATSSVTATIQKNAVGFNGVQTFDFTQVKQIGMAGSPQYTADTVLTANYGGYVQLKGTISIANSSSTIQGYGTTFTSQLVIGESLTWTNDAGSSVTRIIQAIISDTQLILSSAVGGSDVTTKSNVNLGYALIQGSQNNISIFPLPYNVIQTLAPTISGSASNNTNFSVRRQFVGTLSGGSITITAGTNEIFSAIVDKDYDVSIISLGSATAGAVGDVLAVTGNNYASSTIATLSGTPTGKSLTLNYGTNYANATVKILATVYRSVTSSKTKTVTSGTTTITTSAAANAASISLGKADVIAIQNIYMSANFSTTPTTSSTDVTNRYLLDNGQRDNYYDLGRITLKTGQIAPTGQLLINFAYFAHGAGDYFSVDSYPTSVTTPVVANYTTIPSYTSDTTGIVYNLRDCVDFRPRVADDSTINGSSSDRNFSDTGSSTVDVLQFNSGFRTDLSYYLPKIDKVFLDKDGLFKLIEGNSSLNPQIPKGLDSAMQLYTLYLNAYTFSINDVSIQKVDNRRYTMRDIGRLETRIANVEYYTQLSLLETHTQTLQILDSSGLDRYKNGFFVDNFTGHGIGDPTNLDYKVAMDYSLGNMRPTCTTDSINLIETNTTNALRTNNNYQRTGSLITLPYTETTAINQPYASHYENVNPFSIFTWAGSIVLDPPGDIWKETNRVPDLLINQQGSFDTLAANLGNPNLTSYEISTVWNDWQDFWIGAPVETSTSSGVYRGTNQATTTALNGAAAGQTRAAGGFTVLAQNITTTTSTAVTQTRTGIRTAIVPQIVSTSLGDKVLSVAFIPYIRSKTVNFTATRMKPNTQVYAFFDNIDVNAYVAPTYGVAVTTTAGTPTGLTYTLGDGTTLSGVSITSTNGTFTCNSSTNLLYKGETLTISGTLAGTGSISGYVNVSKVYYIISTDGSTSFTLSASNTGVTGNALITDANGSLTGTFTIPDATVNTNPRWRTGTRIFRLTSAITNSTDSVETSAEGDYVATGTIETVQNTIVSSRQATVVRQDVTDTQNLVRTSTRTTQDIIQWIDPIAQTFLVDQNDGMFATSIDLFFQSKDPVIPVTVQIREVVNGYPSRTLVPFGEVTLNPSSVNTSANASVSTRCTFPSPVYLQDKTEYCFCVLSNSNNYNVWVGTIGETQVGSNRTISTNPYAGVYFKSQNGSTWTADQTTDIMFNLNRAAFSNVTGTVSLNNDIVPAKLLPQNPIRTTLSSSVVRVFHRSHGMHSSNDYVTISGISSGTYNGISSTALNGTFTNLQNITLDSYDIDTGTVATASGDIGGNIVYVTQNKLMDVANLNISTLTVPNTSMNYNLTTHTGKSVNGSETPYTTSNSSNVHITDNIYFNAPQLIASAINETNKLSGAKSLTVTASLSTTYDQTQYPTVSISPVIDMGRIGIVTVQNRLNNPTSINTPNFVDDTQPFGTSSAAVYVSTAINLTNSSTALKVYLTSNVRSTSTVQVYYRTTSSAVVNNITSLSWVPFNTSGNEDVTVTPVIDATFKEYVYSASNLNQFTSFQLKVVLKGTNSSYPPIIQDLRGIALAV